MKKKTIVITAVIATVVVLAAGCTGAYLTFKEEMDITSTIKKVDGKNLYTMDVKGDYYFDEVMNKGITSDKELSAFLSKKISHGFYSSGDAYVIKPGCSVISGMTSEGTHVWGRNFDWTRSVPVVVKCTPNNGYKSISTVEFTNINRDATEINDMGNKMLAVAGIYVPMDGINEKGLCIADLEVNEGGMIKPNTDKKDITITMAIRLALNKAATVDEAVTLLGNYDIHPSGDISHHLAVSDKTGKSVSIEFNNGEMVVVETPVVTNTNLTNPDLSVGGESSKKRYETLKNMYDQNDGIISKDDVVKGMKDVSQTEGQWVTKWSIAYEYNTTIEADYYLNGDFSNKTTITL